MEDLKKKTKRWSVTYTKHINQKRKVYQDGFLDFHISTNKMKLYDACENLLECRVLKKDEVVGSGETLSFTSYLVDVWDTEGDDNNNSKPNVSNAKKFNNGKNNVDVQRARRLNNLSPSQKIIREFKKNEQQKYGAWQSSLDTTKTGTTEWQVLYTTQITQKAKKYHDGFLQLTICGSTARQIMLFDGTKRLLDSRFLKKDEAILAGESIAFDAHLVEIGETEGNHKPQVVTTERSNCNKVAEPGIRHGLQNFLGSNVCAGKEFLNSEVHTHGAQQSSPDKSCITEWQVMYTTQVTQKAKKYHDGLLSLALCGSSGKQVKLYDASRRLLSSLFLKKDEVVRPGESMTFDGYIVDIGESQENHQTSKNLNFEGNNCNVEKSGIKHAPKNVRKDSMPVVKDKPQNISSSGQYADSHSRKSASMKKPVRDAHQILSILQRTVAQESAAARSSNISQMKPDEATKELQVSDSTKDIPDNGELGRTEEPDHESNGNLSISEVSDNMDNSKTSEIMSPKVAVTRYSGSQVIGDSDIGNTQQRHVDNMGTDSIYHEEASDSVDDQGKSSEVVKSTREMDDCPSFNLGF